MGIYRAKRENPMSRNRSMSGLSIGESRLMWNPAVISQAYSVVVFGFGIISPGREMKREAP
jgi:hypothetical protein